MHNATYHQVSDVTQDGDSPLMIAFKDERIDFVQYLVEAGASLDLQNKVGI